MDLNKGGALALNGEKKYFCEIRSRGGMGEQMQAEKGADGCACCSPLLQTLYCDALKTTCSTASVGKMSVNLPNFLSFISAKNQLEFCCHMLRGTIDPKEPSTYEYVRFIGNFKSLNSGKLTCFSYNAF